jgi:hypothetical protein
LSIVIPALGTPEALEKTLLSVLENRPHGCQIVVALGIEYANPYQLDDEVQILAAAGRSWVECVNSGLARCRADLVHVLTAGTLVESGWTKPALVHFAKRETGLVAPLVVDAHDPSRVLLAGLRRGVGGTRRCVRAAAGDERRGQAPSSIAGFYRMPMLAKLGGFSAAVGDEYADLDLALRAAAAGWQTTVEAKSRVFHAGLPRMARSVRSGMGAERFFWRHLPADGRGAALAAHAITVAAELLAGAWRPRNVMHTLGRLAGWWPAPVDCQAMPWPVVVPRKGRREPARVKAPVADQRRVA